MWPIQERKIGLAFRIVAKQVVKMSRYGSLTNLNPSDCMEVVAEDKKVEGINHICWQETGKRELIIIKGQVKK